MIFILLLSLMAIVAAIFYRGSIKNNLTNDNLRPEKVLIIKDDQVVDLEALISSESPNEFRDSELKKNKN